MSPLVVQMCIDCVGLKRDRGMQTLPAIICAAECQIVQHTSSSAALLRLNNLIASQLIWLRGLSLLKRVGLSLKGTPQQRAGRLIG